MDTKINGTFNGTVVSGYPQLSGESGQDTVTLKYAVLATGFVLPGYGSAFDPAPWPWIGTERKVLKSRQVEPTETDEVLEVTLKYAPPGAGNVPRNGSGGGTPEENGFREFEFERVDNPTPLSSLSNYRTNWDHCLIANMAWCVSTLPPWYTTAQNTLMPIADANYWRWMTPGDQIPDGWYIMARELKPGVESKRAGVGRVIETVRSYDLDELTALKDDDYTIKAPAKTFGESGKWLRGPSRIRQDGDIYILTMEYTNAAAIDPDLYP